MGVSKGCLDYAAQEVADAMQSLDCPEETTRNEKPVMISRGTQTRKFKPKFKFTEAGGLKLLWKRLLDLQFL